MLFYPVKVCLRPKSITAREVFRRCSEVKKKLWGGNFWSSGYYVATVSEHGNEEVIANYVKNQGDEYTPKNVHGLYPHLSLKILVHIFRLSLYRYLLLFK